MPSARMSLGRAAHDVTDARHFLAAELGRWGLEPLRQPLELAVSELVTNAVTHGRGDVELALRYEGGNVLAEVSDQGGGRPSFRPADDSGQLGGWGLRLVERVADDWGTVVADGRTTVWLRLATPAPVAATPPPDTAPRSR